MSGRKRVVVTGYGALASLGENSDEIWQSILAQRLGYRVTSVGEERVNARFFGFLEPNANRLKGLPRSLLKALPDYARHALVAAREAVRMAFPDGVAPQAYYSPFDSGVIVGTGWGGLDTANYNNCEYRQSGFATSYSTVMSMTNVATAALSMFFELRGHQSTAIAACASGAIAIGDAVEVIRSGRAKMMLAGGSESLREQLNVYCIDLIGALSKEQTDPVRACCPFSKGRSGFVLSEGAAILCLEEYESARARGARILGEVTGYGNFSDAYDLTAPAADRQARVRAIQAALADARLQPRDLHYVNAHGTSTPLNDVNESDSIKEALGADAYRLPISSTKSYTGHLIGAAGALESLICLKVIASGVIPATANLREPDPDCDLDYVPNEHRRGNVRRCLNLSFGFGGANAALVIEEPPQ
jgi:3-oxoacyl-[acyl-carrier-protein] synthase II